MGLPKCMLDIGGTVLLSRLIRDLQPLVGRIHVVVGYREELIIEHCERHHRDVVLVRNPDYRDTNTSHSLMLGSVGFHRKVLYMDGDLVVRRESLAAFIKRGRSTDLLVGVTKAKSTEAVFVEATGNGGANGSVTRFQRDPATPWEWGNLFIGRPDLLTYGNRYVYECIEPHLPAAAQEVDLFEVDTAEDLALATQGTKAFDRGS